MGTIASTFASVYRDYIVDGVPASGDHDPLKSEIRGIGTIIETALGTLSLGSVSVTKDTRAHLNSDLAHADSTVALVYADTTDANNDLYVKAGASGSGSWTLTNILHLAISGLAASAIATATAQAVLAGHYANDNVNSDVPGGSAGDRGAKYWAGQAAGAASAVPSPLDNDKLVGARAAAVLPLAQALTVSGNSFTIPTGGANIPVNLTGDQIGDTATPVVASVQIVSGSAGTAFSVAIGRWANGAGTQIGGDVTLTKTAAAISLPAGTTQPAGARKLTFFLTPPATTIARFMTYQLGTPARPITDAWFLALQGSGVAGNDPAPIGFMASGSNWNPIAGRVTVPATAGGSIYLAVPGGVNDGDVLWVMFDSPLEPTAWLQSMNPRYGSSGGGAGSAYVGQVLHVGGNRFACALYVQSAADGAFYGPGWTWNNTGAATYFENIKLYVGPSPPWVENVSNIALKGIRDEIDAARIKPLITLADDSCGISSDMFQPNPGKSLTKFLGAGTKFQNLSTPGNNLAQSASTVGLLPIHVSVSGGAIPASTAPVSITAWDQDPITSNGPFNPEYDPYAYLCGVLGRISAGGFSGVTPTSLFFTPVTAPTWPIDVPAGSKLILRASRKRKGGLTLFPLSSVNGVGGGFASAVALADAIFAAHDPSTIAGFIGLTPSPYDTGASLLTPFVGKSYYGRLYNPNIMSAATVAEAMALFGWTWAAGEAAAWAAGNIGIPGSMRIVADGFHPYTDEAAYVLAKNHFISSQITTFLETWDA